MIKYNIKRLKMVNYNNSKIYKIEPTCEHDEGDIYVGSTTKTLLSQRMTAHRGDYSKWKKEKRHFTTSFLIFDKYGLENCNIILIENVENCNSKNDLHAREAHHIKTLKCVNKVIPNRTTKEYLEDTKYYEHNKEHCQQWRKQHYEKNKEQMTQKNKQYQEKNKEKIKQQRKEHRETNKQIIKEKKLKQCVCSCGSTYSHCSKARHERSNKHQTFLKNNIECVEL